MPSVSQKQHDLMVAVSKDKELAEKMNIDQKVAKEFIKKDEKEGLWQEAEPLDYDVETVTLEDAEALRDALDKEDVKASAPLFRMEDRFVGEDEEESE